MLILDHLKRNDPQLRLLAIAVLAGLSLLMVGLWWVQVVRTGAYQSHLDSQSLRTVRVPAMRGKILDREGRVLAENRPNYNVDLYLEDLREQFKDEYERICPEKVATNLVPFWKRPFVASTVSTQRVRLSSRQSAPFERQARFNVASNVIFTVSERLGQAIPVDFAQFNRHYASRRALPYPILNNLEPAQIARFEEQFSGEVGADLEIQSTRYYPNGTNVAHVLGHLRRDDRSVAGEESFYSYRLPDYMGVVGVEGYFDSQLHGRAGAKSVLVNNLGYRQGENLWTDPQPGEDVVLTIDLRIQKAAEQALARRVVPPKNAGAVVVMDVNTGDILAMASLPTFDPNDFAEGITLEKYRRLQELTAEKNRATQENYAPGSIFKTIVGLACLESGLNPDKEINNPGHIYIGRRFINDLAPAGSYDFRRAIVRSSNTYFITNGLRAGIQNIINLGKRLHLGERCNLPTWQDASGDFPTSKRVGSGWSDGQTANICIGQGEIAVTPMQMAVMTAAIANGGKVLWPRLVDRIESQNPLPGETPEVFESGRARDNLGVSARSLKILHEAMLAETEDQEGTGKAAVVRGLRICGKTGTAQVTDVQNRVVGQNTWFVSFAPYEKPKYAVVVMVEGGSSGGGACAPVAHDIYTAIQKIDGVAGNQSLAHNN